MFIESELDSEKKSHENTKASTSSTHDEMEALRKKMDETLSGHRMLTVTVDNQLRQIQGLECKFDFYLFLLSFYLNPSTMNFKYIF
jgi:hypothetical protein